MFYFRDWHIPVKGQGETFQVPYDIHYHQPLILLFLPVAGSITAQRKTNLKEKLMKNYTYDLFGNDTEMTINFAEKISKYGVKNLTDIELIEALVRPYITSEKSVRTLTSTILDSINNTITLKIENLTSIKGVSKELASGIMIALELGRRKGESKERTITSPADIYRETFHYACDTVENFVVIAMNGAHEVIFSKGVTKGLINRTLVHPREVFADAIEARATAIAVVHNHPSGNLEPSDEDIRVTERLIKAGELLGIKVIDHLVISQTTYFSFVEHGLM